MAEDIKKMPVGAGLPEMPEEIKLAPKKIAIDWKRIIFILLGLALFFTLLFHAGIWRTQWTPRASTFPCRPKAAWPWASFSWPRSGGSSR